MADRENIFTPMQGECTSELQTALNLAAANEGVLTLAAGVHLCGPLRLPNGAQIHFSKGAILRFLDDYDAYAANSLEVVAEDSNRAMIYGYKASNIRISGEGVIEAPGSAFIVGRLDDMGTHVPAALRPRVLVLDGCSNVELDGFGIHKSPMWTIHLIRSNSVSVSRLHIDNDREMPNTDGIVIDSCTDVTIRDCDISTADDGIVLKTSKGQDGAPIGTCANITVQNCRVESRSCALKIGTETHGDISKVSFVDCDIVQSNRALGIFSRDGGRISDIIHRNIRIEARETPDGFWGSGEAITVNVVDRRPGAPAGRVEALTYENISGSMEGAINLVADSLSGIANVQMKGLSIEQREGRYRGHRYDVRPTHFDLAPSPDAAGRANAWVKDENGQVIGLVPYPDGMPALFASNIEALSLHDIEFTRPSTLPEGWNETAIVQRTGAPSVWS